MIFLATCRKKKNVYHFLRNLRILAKSIHFYNATWAQARKCTTCNIYSATRCRGFTLQVLPVGRKCLGRATYRGRCVVTFCCGWCPNENQFFLIQRRPLATRRPFGDFIPARLHYGSVEWRAIKPVCAADYRDFSRCINYCGGLFLFSIGPGSGPSAVWGHDPALRLANLSSENLVCIAITWEVTYKWILLPLTIETEWACLPAAAEWKRGRKKIIWCGCGGLDLCMFFFPSSRLCIINWQPKPTGERSIFF